MSRFVERPLPHFLLAAALVLAAGSLLLKGSGSQREHPAEELPLLPVLVYHRVSDRPLPGDGGRVLAVADFEAHLRYLREAEFTSLFLEEVLEIREGKRPCPDRPVVLTFDDGYDDNLYEAYPLLRKYGFKATVFPIVGRMGHWGHLTWTKIKRFDPAVVRIGSHTMTHAALKGLTRQRLEYELGESKARLEACLLLPVKTIAFPYGAHDDLAVTVARAAGYEVACTTRPGRNRFMDDPMRLRRYTVLRGHTLEQIARWVGGPAVVPIAD